MEARSSRRMRTLVTRMAALGHFRPTLRVSAAVRCLLFAESDLLTARQRNDAKGASRLAFAGFWGRSRFQTARYCLSQGVAI